MAGGAVRIERDVDTAARNRPQPCPDAGGVCLDDRVVAGDQIVPGVGGAGFAEGLAVRSCRIGRTLDADLERRVDERVNRSCAVPVDGLRDRQVAALCVRVRTLEGLTGILRVVYGEVASSRLAGKVPSRLTHLGNVVAAFGEVHAKVGIARTRSSDLLNEYVGVAYAIELELPAGLPSCGDGDLFHLRCGRYIGVVKVRGPSTDVPTQVNYDGVLGLPAGCRVLVDGVDAGNETHHGR